MLLKRTRRITQLLQNDGDEVTFSDIARVVATEMEETCVYVVNRKGKVLGYALPEGYETTDFDSDWLMDGKLPDEYNEVLLRVGTLTAEKDVATALGVKVALICPVVGNGRRLGTFMMVRLNGRFNDDDSLVAEIASTIIGMIMAHAVSEEEEDEVTERKMAISAIRSLSYSEIVAMQRIFDELNGDEGLLVASRVADEAGITRSVVVNALRKLSSANVIESRSLGMKGTYLRILNKEIRKELEAQRYPYPAGAAELKKKRA
ncbi:MAG: GTP-sensing pleiotropic transcriptional regulator CodY [Limnochordia bacterium]|jgi:transcriptional pleiotropic repressor|nr:GTP-sensing pleiotropic transcriptional regulator CodY [Limnochordia bacterium]MDD4517897.1 GTP-sensing pleiotropic transcriptional regulator CodY [Limnochordia bacterium]